MKKYQTYCQPWLFASLLAITLTSSPYAVSEQPQDNLIFSGSLVALPCILAEGKNTVELGFGTIAEKTFYYNDKVNTRPFKLELAECDLDVGNYVRIYFTGMKNSALPSLLALDPSSGAAGIAVGFQTEDGQPLPLEKETSKYLLKSGDNVITFNAYLKGEPEAVAKQNIVVGDFTATATFNLEYE